MILSIFENPEYTRNTNIRAKIKHTAIFIYKNAYSIKKKWNCKKLQTARVDLRTICNRGLNTFMLLY